MPLPENFFIFFVINVIFLNAFSAYFAFFSKKQTIAPQKFSQTA